MEDFQSANTVRHVYRLKRWAQGGYLALALLLGGGGVSFILFGLMQGDWTAFTDLRTVCVMVFPTALGSFFAALALRSRVVLDGTRISVRYALGEVSADSSEIEGYRNTHDSHYSYWRLRLKESGTEISIMKSFRVDEAFQTFLSQLKNFSDIPDQ